MSVNRENGRKPNLFMVGAPKTGTTAMHTWLRQHPDIYMSPIKEPLFFGSDLPGDRYCRDMGEYLDLFKDATTERFVGESSPYYLFSSNAATEIKAFSPDARIIIMLRDPVAIIESLHSRALFSGNEDVADIRQALALEPERRQGKRLPQTAHIPQATFYRAIVDFAPQLDRYFETFGRDRVHVAIFEEGVAVDPAIAYAGILRFLGVDDTYQPVFENLNSNATVRSSRLRRLYLNPPAPVRSTVRRFVPRTFVRRIWTRGLWPVLYKMNTKRAPRQPMPDDVKATLRRETRETARTVGRMLDRDLEALWQG